VVLRAGRVDTDGCFDLRTGVRLLPVAGVDDFVAVERGVAVNVVGAGRRRRAVGDERGVDVGAALSGVVRAAASDEIDGSVGRDAIGAERAGEVIPEECDHAGDGRPRAGVVHDLAVHVAVGAGAVVVAGEAAVALDLDDVDAPSPVCGEELGDGHGAAHADGSSSPALLLSCPVYSRATGSGASSISTYRWARGVASVSSGAGSMKRIGGLLGGGLRAHLTTPTRRSRLPAVPWRCRVETVGDEEIP
jgi:hypothetical protein